MPAGAGSPAWVGRARAAHARLVANLDGVDLFEPA
jgi:hypothetical protein